MSAPIESNLIGCKWLKVGRKVVEVNMAYAKGVLAGVTAILGVLFVPALIRFFGGPEKATGLAFVWASLFEALLSPLFWTKALCVFGLLFLASRLGSKGLRVLLFWTPAIATTWMRADRAADVCLPAI